MALSDVIIMALTRCWNIRILPYPKLVVLIRCCGSRSIGHKKRAGSLISNLAGCV